MPALKVSSKLDSKLFLVVTELAQPWLIEDEIGEAPDQATPGVLADGIMDKLGIFSIK